MLLRPKPTLTACNSRGGPVCCANWVYRMCLATRQVFSSLRVHRGPRKRVWEFRPAGLNHRSRPVAVVPPEDPGCGSNSGNPAGDLPVRFGGRASQSNGTFLPLSPRLKMKLSRLDKRRKKGDIVRNPLDIVMISHVSRPTATDLNVEMPLLCRKN